MWRVTVQSYNPFYGCEYTNYNSYDFNSDLEAWRFHELIFKATNVKSVSKPEMII